MHKASVETVDYLKANPEESQSHESPFKFRQADFPLYTFCRASNVILPHRWGLPFYEWYEQNPEKGERFATAQEGIAKCETSLLSPRSDAMADQIQWVGAPTP
jgi:hypothetical protein